MWPVYPPPPIKNINPLEILVLKKLRLLSPVALSRMSSAAPITSQTAASKLRRRRTLGLTLTALLLAWGSPGGYAAAGITLTVSRWAGPQADGQRQLLDEYAKAAGVTVKLDAIDYGQLKQKQTLNMRTKTGEYDLVYVPEAWMGEYAKAGYLTSLDNYVTNPKLTGDDWNFADLAKVGLNIYTVDGSLLALPYFVQTPLLVYNQDALKQGGFAAPKTWADLLKIAKYFKEKGSGIALPYRQGSAITDILAVLLAGNGASSLNPEGKLALNQPAVVETVKFMQELCQHSLNGSKGWHWDEVNKALQFGQAPMGITASGLVKALEDENDSNVAGKLGYAAIPYNKQPAALLQSWAWAVPADSKHQEERFKLAEGIGRGRNCGRGHSAMGMMTITAAPSSSIQTPNVRAIHGDQRLAILLLLPAAMTIFLVMIVPLGFALYASLFDYSLGQENNMSFVFLHNYARFFADPVAFRSLINTVVFTLLSLTLRLSLVLVIAVLLKRINPATSSVLRAIFSMPLLISPIIVGLVWRYIYDPTYGLAYYLLRFVGLQNFGGLTSSATALLCIVVADVWHTTPFIILFASAGLTMITAELFHAARLDRS